MVIFSEKAQYNKLVSDGFERCPNVRDLLILAKWWYFNQNIPKKDIKNKLSAFCKSKFSKYCEATYEKTLINVLKKLNSIKEYTEKANEIVFFQQEIDKILGLKDKKMQRLMFVIMSIAKQKNQDFIFLNATNPVKLSEIFRIADIKCTLKEQELMLFRLNQEGFLKVNIKPMLKYDILIIENSGKEVLRFISNEKMILEWYKFADLETNRCNRCGKKIQKSNNKQKYCEECAKIVKNEQNLEYLKNKKLGK